MSCSLQLELVQSDDTALINNFNGGHTESQKIIIVYIRPFYNFLTLWFISQREQESLKEKGLTMA